MSADLPKPEGDSALPSDWVAWIDGDGEPAIGDAAIGDTATGDTATGEAVHGAWSEALKRARAQAKVLRSLPRIAAPAALDGAVVAALHAGHTEDRARAQVAALRPLNAPAALDDAVARAIEREVEASPSGIVAPPQLDGLVERLVAAEADAPAAVPAPTEELSPLDRFRADSGSGRRRRRPVWVSVPAAVAAAAVAAAAVLIVGAYFTGETRADRNADGANPKVASFIELVPVTADDLSPADRAVLFQFGAQLRGGRS